MRERKVIKKKISSGLLSSSSPHRKGTLKTEDRTCCLGGWFLLEIKVTVNTWNTLLRDSVS